MADKSAPTVGGAAAGTPPDGSVLAPIPFDPSIQLGRSGLRQYGGFLFEEFLRTLRGKQGAEAYREVIDNSPLVGGIIRLLKLTMRQVNKFVEPFDQHDAGDVERAKRVEQALDDMSVTWADMMAEIATMLGYGYAPMEIVWKACRGWSDDGTTRSKFSDGLIMPRKIFLLAQDTLFRWHFDEDGGVRAFVQLPPPDYVMRTIPIEKMLLFRPEMEKGNPEGNSIIRSGYFSWITVKRMMEFEAITGERYAVGVPVARIPSNTMLANATTTQKAVFSQFKKAVQNLRVDDQAGLVIPSDVWPGTQEKMFDIKLMGAEGRATQYNYGEVITRHEVRLAISMLADVMLLGHDKVGSFALSHDKKHLLSAAIDAWLDAICEVINRHLFMRIFAYNGWPLERPCKLGHGGVEEEDLDQIAAAVLKLAQAGMPLFPDEVLENHIREEAGWPEITRDEDSESGVEDIDYSGPPLPVAGTPGGGQGGGKGTPPAGGAAPPGKGPAGKKPSPQEAKKFLHQPRDRRERYSQRGGDVMTALTLLRDRAPVGRDDVVNHGFHVAEPPPYDPRAVTAGMIDSAPTERVDVNSLRATQPTVRRDGVRRFLENPGAIAPGQRSLSGELVDRPVIVRRGGTDYIHDGHHRLAGRVLMGYGDAMARVVDGEGLPANQGTPRGASSTYDEPVAPQRDVGKAPEPVVEKTPPWVIRERGGKYEVVGQENGKVYGTHDTRESALAQMRALYANVPDARKTTVPLSAVLDVVRASVAQKGGDGDEALRLIAAALRDQTAAAQAQADAMRDIADKGPMEVNVEVPAAEPPVIQNVISVPPQPTPIVNVEAKPGETVVNVAAPSVTVENPEARPTVKEIERDEWGRIDKVVERPLREDGT